MSLNDVDNQIDLKKKVNTKLNCKFIDFEFDLCQDQLYRHI